MKAKTDAKILLAILAAALYALNAPFSKLLLDFVPPTLMAGFLYFGAGIGMLLLAIFRRLSGAQRKEKSFSKSDMPYVIAMVLLDIAAPIFLLVGLNSTTAANASLLNNFEIVATAVIAFAVFKEKISTRLFAGIIFVTLSCALLSFEDLSSIRFSYGSLFIILACICWGVENNCTRRLSQRDPTDIVIIKGIFSGLGSLCIGYIIGERTDSVYGVLAVLCVGFVAYGLSIYFYVYAQRYLGAARTSAYYAVAPFIGAMLSFMIFTQMPEYTYFAALFLLVVGAWLCSRDEPIFRKKQ